MLNLTNKSSKNVLTTFLILQRIIIHENYSSRSKYDDIALIELANAITFTENVKPICLQTDSNEDERGKNFTIIGFGIKDLNTSEF